MTKQTFKEFLNESVNNYKLPKVGDSDTLVEMPVSDYKTFGNFEKGSSFRSKADRKMITSDKAIKNVHKKFGKTSYDFNLYFVNSAKANRHLEVGKVDMAWVEKNLDPEVAQALHQNSGIVNDSINVIYTNNKGDARVPLTPFMMAHRFFHSVRRSNGMTDEHSAYAEAEKHLVSQIGQIMQYYGKQQFRPDKFAHDEQSRNSIRRDQLAMLYLFHHIATFKSARDKNLRDWFEILNELGAQYIITGGITFNPPPQCVQGGAGQSRQNFCAKREDMEELTQSVDTLSRDMEMMINDVLSSAVGNIYVM